MNSYISASESLYKIGVLAQKILKNPKIEGDF